MTKRKKIRRVIRTNINGGRSRHAGRNAHSTVLRQGGQVIWRALDFPRLFVRKTFGLRWADPRRR